MHFQNTGRAALAVFAFSFLGAGAVHAASCSKATLDGAYGALSSGYSGTNSPTAGLFRLVADGAGNVTGTGVQSDDGTIETETFSGTYTVAKDCTGTMSLIDQTSIHADYNFIVDAKTSHFEFVRTDGGFNEAGAGETLGTGTCSLRAKGKKVYANRLRQLPPFPIDIVGQVTVANSGKVKGVETVVANGSGGSEKVSGTLTVNADCTGTLQLQGGGATFNFATLVVEDGSLDLVETDPSSTISGTATPQ